MVTQHRTIPDYLAALEPEPRAQVELLREIVRSAGPALEESIKWNAPSYAQDGVHRLTVNTAGKAGRVRLVLHMGTARAEVRGAPPVIDDPAGLVAWSSDIRGVLAFADLAELEDRRAAVADVLRRWLAVPV